MGRLSELSDRELDRLLAGKMPSGGGNLEELVSFIRDLRESCEESPAEVTAARHLAAIVEAAQLLGETEELAATRTRQGSSPDRGRSPRLVLRRNQLGHKTRVKLAAAAGLLLLLAAFAGAAYAGELPGPVQGTVADLADNIGIQVDDGQANDSDDGPVNDIDDGAVNDTDDGAVGDADDGAAGDADDGAAGDADDGGQESEDSSGSQGNGDQGNGNN